MFYTFLAVFLGTFCGFAALSLFMRRGKAESPFKVCAYCDYVCRTDEQIRTHVKECEKHPYKQLAAAAVFAITHLRLQDETTGQKLAREGLENALDNPLTPARAPVAKEM